MFSAVALQQEGRRFDSQLEISICSSLCRHGVLHQHKLMHVGLISCSKKSEGVNEGVNDCLFHSYCWTSAPDLCDPEQDAACKTCMDDWIKSSFLSKSDCVNAESTVPQGARPIWVGRSSSCQSEIRSHSVPQSSSICLIVNECE